MEPISLRAAGPTDAECIARINRSARSAAMPWLPVLHTPEEDVWFFARKVLPHQAVRIAEFDGLPAGFIAVERDWINHLYVDPAHWRLGIGTLLLRHAMSNASSLQLWTFRENRSARNFYAKFGFQEVAFTDGSDNEEQMPDVRLVWERDAPQP